MKGRCSTGMYGEDTDSTVPRYIYNGDMVSATHYATLSP
jgi:hypothetical protein